MIRLSYAGLQSIVPAPIVSARNCLHVFSSVAFVPCLSVVLGMM